MPPPRFWDLALILACAVAGTLELLLVDAPGGWTAWQIAMVGVGIAGIGAIPWRERRPVLFAVVAGVVSTIAPLAGHLSLVGVYTVAKRCPWRVALAVTAYCGCLAVLGVVQNVDRTVYPLFPYLLASVTLMVAAGSAGLFAGAREALLGSLRERAERAEADQAEQADEVRFAERRRIAGEMHDALGHRLSLLSVHAGALELRADLPPETVRSTAEVLRATTQAALADLRQIILVLREPVAELGGITPPLETLDDVQDLVDQACRAGTPAELTISEGLRSRPPPELLCRTTYRVVQEGLTNALRHRPGSEVRIEIDGVPLRRLTVQVTTAAPRPGAAVDVRTGSGTGLIGLSERVVALTGGSLVHDVDGAQQHRLRAEMPWPEVPRG